MPKVFVAALVFALTLAACTAPQAATPVSPSPLAPEGQGSVVAAHPVITPVAVAPYAPNIAGDTASNAATSAPTQTDSSAPMPHPAGTGLAAAETTNTPAPPGTIRPAVLATGLANPDDLAIAADGSLYISDVGDGTVSRLGKDGKLQAIAWGLSEPEGIVVLPDGSLIVAEQGKNRLERVDPATGKSNPFLQLTNRTGGAGVDGISLDPRRLGGPWLIVPDSPNGTVLRVSLDGKQLREIGHGFVRPVAAWAAVDGSLIVADEFGNTLVRLADDGSKQILAHLPQPDDVTGDDSGHLYANTLVDGAIHAIRLPDGQDTILVPGLAEPQGLVLDSTGALFVADSGHGRLLRVALQR